MSDSNGTDGTLRFYETFPFPGMRPMDQDGLILLRHLSATVKARSGTSMGAGLRLLDAGCGTGNTSVALARLYAGAEVVAIDQSGPSLERARGLAEHEGLTNIHVVRHDLMTSLPRGESYDIILCLGVLHHLADMKRGLSNLKAVLKNDGHLYLWIYGKHGRYLHSLNMRCLQMLTGSADTPEETVQVAEEFVRKTDDGSPLKLLLGRTPLKETQWQTFTDPVWIADQFLNPHEVLIDMEELLEMLDEVGLELREVLGGNVDMARLLNSPHLYKRFQMLDERRKLIAKDLLLKPERYFVHLTIPEE